MVSSCSGDLGSVAVMVRSDDRLGEGAADPLSGVRDAVVGVDVVKGDVPVAADGREVGIIALEVSTTKGEGDLSRCEASSDVWS